MFSTRAHRPTDEFQPMMDDMIHACSLTWALDMMTHRCSLTPAPILQPGPMTTLGPIRAVGSTSAVCGTRAQVQVSSRALRCVEKQTGGTHGVDEDVASLDPRLLGVREKRRRLRREVREVEAGTCRQQTSRSVSQSEKAASDQVRTSDVVLGLSNVHPEALEVERVELSLRSNEREDLLLDRGGLELFLARKQTPGISVCPAYHEGSRKGDKPQFGQARWG